MTAEEREPAGPPSLEDLVAEFVERREAGEELGSADFAREHPGREAELLAALGHLRETEALFPSGPGDGDGGDLPRRVGRFRVVAEIGRGAMGRVLAAEPDDRPGSAVALKLLHPTAEWNPRTRERFLREGRALEALRHPSLVRVLETGFAGASPYIAMERVEGASLGELLDRARDRRPESGDDDGRRPQDRLELGGEGSGAQRAARLAARLARAVGEAHRAGVLHRDVKPRNVLVRPDGTPVLIDFGLVHAEGAPTLTATGDLIGTPQYMAPEQSRGERSDERSDVFALGALLFELLTLRPPRSGQDALAVLRAAGSRPLPSPRAANPSLPRDLDAVVRRATAFRPAWRYASADELADDLERWLEGASVSASGPGLAERAFGLWVRRRRAILGAAALAVVALLAFALRPRESDAERVQRVQHARREAMAGWLVGDLDRTRAAARDLARFPAEAEVAEFLLALGGERELFASDHPVIGRLLEGERKRRAGRPVAAMLDFEVALNLWATAVPLVLLGVAAREAGDLAKAEEAFARAAPGFTNWPELHRTLAGIYRELGRPADAVKALTIASSLAPDDAPLLAELASAQLAAGDPAGARETIERALALGDPESREALQELAEALDAGGATDGAAPSEGP